MALGTAGYVGIGYNKEVELNKPIYKFIPFQRFLEMLDNNYLYFRNVLRWDDNWEIPTRLFQSEGLEGLGKLFLEKDCWHETFATCFTERYDTDAMWRIYSPNKNSICIETTAAMLLQELTAYNNEYSVYYAPIIYCSFTASDAREIFNEEKAKEYPAQFYGSYLKRDAFAHEREVRLAIQSPKYNFENKNPPDGIQLPVNLRNIVRRIIIDPRLTQQEAAFYIDGMDKLGFRTEQSALFSGVLIKGKEYEEQLNKVLSQSITGTKFRAFTQNKMQ